MKKKGQLKLVEPEKREIDKIHDMNARLFRKRVAKLRETYKRYKAGLITEEQISEEDKQLLRKYYGVRS